MTTYSLPPGCTGVELPNGKKYDANRQGKVVIDDTREDRVATKSMLRSNGIISKTALGFGHVKENTAVCSKCIFRGFGWQTECPKCGAEMVKVTE